jgi:hypothetical protein
VAFCIITCLLAVPTALPQEQNIKDKWQRVYTGDESIIEIHTSNHTFEPSRVLRVEIRTTLTKPEKISSTSETRYKTRLEKIDFKLTEKQYRIFETTIMDAAGKTLTSYQTQSAKDWRVIKPAGVMERIFNAARVLPPFGTWKTVSYRFAEGGSSNAALDRLIGTHVRLSSDQATVGTKVCSLPDYQDKPLTKEEFFKGLGVQLDGIGINAHSVETTTVKCSGRGWSPPQSLLIKGADDEMLMLWEGVFLVLKKDHGSTNHFPEILKRRSPQ